MPDREEQFLRYALSAVNVDMRIVRLSDLTALESVGVLPRLWAEGEFSWEERFAKYLPVYGFAAACGKFCVFEHRKGEFHDNDIVLAQHAPYADAETGGAFSIKKIEKRGDEIILRPVNAAYDPITLSASALGGDYKIVGTLRGKI